MEELFNLLNDDSFMNKFSRLYGGMFLPEMSFKIPTLNDYSSFELNDGVYSMSMYVDENATEDNVDITLDKNNVLRLTYILKHKHGHQIFKVRETLPEDADADTLSANIKDGKLIVTVEQIKK